MKNKYAFLVFIILFIFNLSSAIAAPPALQRPFNDITASQLVADIKIGINLGNTFDATDYAAGWITPGWSVSQMESAWANPVITRANIIAYKNMGFNAIRIPVSWIKAADSNYNIRADWMARITEVINWVVENDMYAILNTHHDECTFKFTNAEVNTSLIAFRRIWEQIAHNFRNYNEKLIFEGLNEPRVKGSQAEWSGGTTAERANLNRHYQIFVDVVRASGGNNDKRILMINTYGASASAAAVNGLVLPNDTIPNKLIVSIHAYEPFTFTTPNDQGGTTSTWSRNNSRDTRAVHDAFTPVYNRFVRNGIPVIMGEFGAANKNNTTARAEWAEYYVNYAKNRGIPCFYWDHGNLDDPVSLSIFDRRTNTIVQPEILAALMRGVN